VSPVTVEVGGHGVYFNRPKGSMGKSLRSRFAGVRH
jgi:hypothetical protein